MVVLIVAGGLVAGGFLAAFVVAVRTGQYDDLQSPPLRVIAPDAPRPLSPPAREGANRQ